MRNTNKTKRVLEHLQKHGNITSWEAITKYGATRLSAIIFDLRKSYDIDTVMQEDTDRYGNSTRFAEYIYKGEKHADNSDDNSVTDSA